MITTPIVGPKAIAVNKFTNLVYRRDSLVLFFLYISIKRICLIIILSNKITNITSASKKNCKWCEFRKTEHCDEGI